MIIIKRFIESSIFEDTETSNDNIKEDIEDIFLELLDLGFKIDIKQVYIYSSDPESIAYYHPFRNSILSYKIRLYLHDDNDNDDDDDDFFIPVRTPLRKSKFTYKEPSNLKEIELELERVNILYPMFIRSLSKLEKIGKVKIVDFNYSESSYQFIFTHHDQNPVNEKEEKMSFLLDSVKDLVYRTINKNDVKFEVDGKNFKINIKLSETINSSRFGTVLKNIHKIYNSYYGKEWDSDDLIISHNLKYRTIDIEIK